MSRRVGEGGRTALGRLIGSPWGLRGDMGTASGTEPGAQLLLGERELRSG